LKKPATLLIWIGTISTLINVVFFLLMRSIWTFVDVSVVLPESIPFLFTSILMGFMVIQFLYFIGLLALKLFKRSFRLVLPLKIVSYFILFLQVIILGLNIYLYRMGNCQMTLFRTLVQILPYFGVVFLIIYFTFIHPFLKIGKSKSFRLIIIAGIIVVSVMMIMNIRPVNITSEPVLQYVNPTTIAVIWTTNVNSTGEVLYGQDAGHMKTAYEAEDGLIQANSRLHKVQIPVGDMKELVYQVISTKINNFYQNNIEYGNTVMSSLISYKPALSNEELSFYVLNDIHNNRRSYKDYLTGRDYDFVVSGGDAISSVDNRNVIITDFLNPFGKATGSSKPMFFVRGNHEPRGGEARDLKDYLELPQNKYYYTFTFGPAFAIVLDSGEDKLDSHREYSGLVDFENYKKEETEWLESILHSEEYQAAKYHVVFVHMPLNTFIEGEDNYLKSYEEQWRHMLSEARIDVAFSGHTHIPQLLQPADYDASFPTIIGGGDAWSSEGYLSVRTEVAPQQLTIYFEKTDGTKEEVLKIR